MLELLGRQFKCLSKCPCVSRILQSAAFSDKMSHKNKTPKPKRYGESWTRDELILAYDLYCRIPFKNTKANNSEVQKLSSILQRSPASVARKLGNFGAFDPQLQQQHITGLTHGSKQDREIWDEFHRNWNGLVEEADILRKSFDESIYYDLEISKPTGPSERRYSSKQRIHQTFFRQVVLSSYEYRCCITGLDLPEVLIASHIIPWAAEEDLRADPTNGLCLSATFDKLFDSGLITLTDDLNIAVSNNLLKSKDEHIQQQILIFHNRPIYKPKRFFPSQKFLEWHRVNVFAT